MPRSAIHEAQDAVGVTHTVRVLEPSPPVNLTEPYYADDAVDAEGVEGVGSREIVSPVANADLTWTQLVERRRPDLAEFARERWLGAFARLELPADTATLVATRRALHAVAEHVVSPTRQRAQGAKIGLRWTRGGFGTPFFGNEVQVRVEADELVVQSANRERRERLSTLQRAAEFVGFELTRFDQALAAAPLDVDPAAARFLGELFGFATSVLEELRAGAAPDDAPSRVQLWPEHFDLAVELGADAAGLRAGYGISPGDDEHDEPYLYVTPWARDGFDEIALRAILAEPDQREAALAWLRAHRPA